MKYTDVEPGTFSVLGVSGIAYREKTQSQPDHNRERRSLCGNILAREMQRIHQDQSKKLYFRALSFVNLFEDKHKESPELDNLKVDVDKYSSSTVTRALKFEVSLWPNRLAEHTAHSRQIGIYIGIDEVYVNSYDIDGNLRNTNMSLIVEIAHMHRASMLIGKAIGRAAEIYPVVSESGV